jgi:toxin CcdB
MVTQYDVFKYKNPKTAHDIKYLIVLQSGDFSALQSAIVAPIRKLKKPPMKKLHIAVTINDEDLHISMAELGIFPLKQLGKHESNLSSLHEDVMKALDLLFSGF